MRLEDSQVHLEEGPRVSHISQLNFKYESVPTPSPYTLNARLFVDVITKHLFKKVINYEIKDNHEALFLILS